MMMVPQVTINYQSERPEAITVFITEILLYESIYPISQERAYLIFDGFGCSPLPGLSLSSSYIGLNATLSIVLSNPTNETIEFKIWTEHNLTEGGHKTLEGSIPRNQTSTVTFKGPTIAEILEGTRDFAQVLISTKFLNGTSAFGHVGINVIPNNLGVLKNSFTCFESQSIWEILWKTYGPSIFFVPVTLIILTLYYIRKRKKKIPEEINPYPED